MLKNGIICLLFAFGATCQKIHAHNDYLHDKPLFESYLAGARSIEVDVFIFNGQLLVGHIVSDLSPDRTLKTLYLEYLEEVVKDSGFQLMVDIKTEAELTLNALIQEIESQKPVLELMKTRKVKLVISGNRPKDYSQWPDYVYFDHQKLEETPFPDRVSQFSFSFKNFSSWNGQGRFTKKDKAAIQSAISTVHNWNKPIRFWATPDTPKVWRTLKKMGVDWISTDLPSECSKLILR